MYKCNKSACLTKTNIGFNTNEAALELPNPADSIDIDKIMNLQHMHHIHKSNFLPKNFRMD